VRGKEDECQAEARTILLAISLKRDPQKLRQVLLHEMCHIGSPGHGRRFRAKLARLAEGGESWAEKERCDLADRPRGYSLSADIAHAIDDAVLDLPQVRWSKRVLQVLGNSIGRSPRDTIRAAPWAPQRWERSRRRVIEERDRQRRTTLSVAAARIPEPGARVAVLYAQSVLAGADQGAEGAGGESRGDGVMDRQPGQIKRR
jgi:Protein of unknown function DUF45